MRLPRKKKKRAKKALIQWALEYPELARLLYEL